VTGIGGSTPPAQDWAIGLHDLPELLLDVPLVADVHLSPLLAVDADEKRVVEDVARREALEVVLADDYLHVRWLPGV
jgi:hypothetical protein